MTPTSAKWPNAWLSQRLPMECQQWSLLGSGRGFRVERGVGTMLDLPTWGEILEIGDLECD